jgi:predicted PurR-regulated permease PerM
LCGCEQPDASGGSYDDTLATYDARVVRFEPSLKSVIALVLVGAGAWVIVRLWPVLLVLIVALMIVGTLGPVLVWLEARGVRRCTGIAIVFGALLVIGALILTSTVPSLIDQTTTLIDREPVLRARLVTFLTKSRVTAPLAHWLKSVQYDVLPSDGGASAFAISTRIAAVVAYGVSTIFLALYIIIDRDRLRGGLFAVVPRSHHIRLSRVLMNLETIVGAYIRGQLITSLLMAVFAFALLTACKVPNALALAVVAGVADVLPYVGALLSIGPAFLVALSRGPAVALVVLGMMLAYEEFESRVLIPRIYGRALRLPSSVVLFALLAGGTLMGILGAILALPVAAAAMMLVEELRVELPGEQEQVKDTEIREGDTRAEAEYQRRTAGVAVVEAAAIAVEISADRRSSISS